MEIPQFVRELLTASLIMRTNEKLQMNKEMSEKHVFWQPWLNSADDDTSKQSNTNTTTTKQLPTTKWKRDRRSRLPEYSRKSDPKIAETFGTDPDDSMNDIARGSAANGNNNSQKSPDAPLDMSVRQRGLPPSYSQTVNNPGYRSAAYHGSGKQSVSGSKTTTVNREDLPPGISMCDPIIDEHFRRSLGKDYLTLFSNNNLSKETVAAAASPVINKNPPKLITNNSTTNVIELMDSTGLSVDDHFAKALGDTWLKLNKKESEIKNNTSENNLVSI